MIDDWSEQLTRRLAATISRRSLLSRLGAFFIAAPAFILLPVRRAAPADARTEFERDAQSTDDRQCNYWRYCAVDGHLCTCCGGGIHSCPAGSIPSPTAWIGTCVNPDSGKSYLVAYRDCCGKQACGQCTCDASDRETPMYRPQTNNDIVWCIGLSSMTYHCTTALLVGEV